MAKKKSSSAKKVCSLICPKCTLYWADLRFSYGGSVGAKDVSVHVGPKFKNGDEMSCPGCQHQYTNYDIWLAVASGKSTAKPGARAVKDVASDIAENGEKQENVQA